MIKSEHIWQALFVELTRLIGVAKDSADRAHADATDKECVAENKYDTRGLEASYLAQGQQQRMAQCIEDNALFDRLYKKREQCLTCVELGAIVTLESVNELRHVLIGPSAGGLKLVCDNDEILVITSQSPLGALLMSKEIGDEVRLTVGDKNVCYEITAIN